MDREEEFEKNQLIKDIIKIKDSKENYEEQLTGILNDYIVFRRRRYHETIE